MKVSVIVNLEIEGLHNWPGAVRDDEYYLAYPHRHVFKIRIEFLVQHKNRQIEFIGVNRDLRQYLRTIGKETQSGIIDFGAMSCEMIGAAILRKVKGATAVEVFEDGENGARVEK